MTTLIKLSANDLLRIAIRIDTMRRIEKQVRRINELACNQELTSRQQVRRASLQTEYARLAASFGLFAEMQNDPRGPALKLHDDLEGMESGMGTVL